MNDKPFRIARLIRLAIFLGIVFLFAWMFRWDIGTTAVNAYDESAYAYYTKLDRWTGATYGCVFPVNLADYGVACEQEQP